MDPVDIVTSRPPIRLARSGKTSIASPAACSRRFSREQMAVGRELVDLAEAVSWPSPTPPPDTPPPTPSPPLYSTCGRQALARPTASRAWACGERRV
ncbi:US8A-like protein [pteropodid alphaherpesvirus 2]|uniref:US8A-like protein n=1 Tax=pteropodid alphaherpesvirus 2 TaxID=3118716 RepID=A0A510JA02_9ALPH|nr:US8A-like protein [pteropodid alphaherpesvirus 2]BBM13241.1 US8A-like protein [pteropodid alphaherpesvirus 2]